MDIRESEPQSVELPTTGIQKEKTVDSGDLNVKMNLDYLKDVKKKYKKIQKYMKSSLFAVKVMDGNEKVVSKLLKEFEDNPL
jgi:predicted transcriptional regulator